MPGELGRAALARQRRDRDRGLAHGLGGGAVGEHAVHDRAVELVEVAELLERVGDRGVRQLGRGHGHQSRAHAAATCAVGGAPRSRVRRPMSGEPWLILPTYNEAENVEAIVDAAGEVLAGGGARGLSRADRRRRLARRHRAAGRRACGAEHEWVEVLHRTEKNGIGPAYLAGFRHALERGAGYVMEMDSDFSHDPADLARLLAAVHGGADLALGSRYVPGGGVSDWGLLRRFVSEGGSTYARLVLGLRVSDLTGGFKCFRREVLEAIHFDGVRSQGYAFQVELTYRAVQAGFRVVEVPIVFRDRQQGQSKMSWRIAAEAMWLVPRLRFR